MTRIDDAATAFGGVFVLAHRWQTLGDRLDDRVSTRQWFVLAAITRSTRPDPTLSEVAASIGISRQAVRKLADSLARQGLVDFAADPADARVVRLRLTAECESHLAGRDPAERRFLDEVFGGLDDAEIRSLAVLLGRLVDTADDLVDAGRH